MKTYIDHYFELYAINSVQTQHIMLTFILLWFVFLGLDLFVDFSESKCGGQCNPTFKKRKA